MFQMKQTIVVRQVTRMATAILTVRGDSYGSLDVYKLSQLRADLAAACGDLYPSCERVIVDLAGVTTGGAGFLRELITLIGGLGRLQQEVILCGDQTGLLKLCGTDRRVAVRENLSAAIDVVVERKLDSSRRQSFVATPNLAYSL